MKTSKVIHVVSCHAEGEVGDVIVGGVAPPPGDTIWEQRCFIEKDDRLRRFVLNEPRGGVFRHVNLLVPPEDPHAQVRGRYRARSIIGSEFECGIDSLTALGKTDAIVPTVSGRAWITGTHQLMLDPDDPWPEG